MTRKLIYITLATILVSACIKAQNKKLAKANKNFDRFEFSKAINQYESLIAKGNISSEVFQKLADANYLNANYVEAAKWYEKVAETDTDALDIEHLYRYANSLRSVQKYEASNAILKKLNGSSDKTMSDYMKAIKEQYGSFTIENVDINSAASDFAPSFRLDGLVFSTGRDTNGVSNNTHGWNKKRFLNLYTASNTGDGSFKNIMRFSDKLNTKLHESSTAFTKDGMTVYFTRNKENGKNFGRDAKGISRLKLYKAVFENGKWRKVQALPFNQDGYSVAHPTLNKSEDKLYFASDIEGTHGQSDIFVVDINKDGSFGTPKNLGANINTGGRETFPFVSDDDILYFASDGHAGLGGLDIFAVDLKNVDSSRIVNLGEPLNSPADDFAFIMNYETKKGYFSSNREGGMGDDDIYALTEVKPIDMRCFSELLGIVKNKKTKKVIPNSLVTLLNKDGKTLATTKSDGDGKFMLPLACNQTGNIIVATKESFESDRAMVSANADAITLLLASIDLGAPIGTDLAKYLNIKPIYFDLNQSYIRDDAKVILEKIMAYLNEYPNTKIEVRSHTDSRASSTYNADLSNRRAKETVAYLISKGIRRDRINGVGFGESQLTNDCKDGKKCSEEKHQKNRRSEFIVVD